MNPIPSPLSQNPRLLARLWHATLAWGAFAFLGAAGALASDGFLQTPNPATAGLWIGDATLRFVSYPTGGTVDGVASTVTLRIILHVDSSGQVRLLKDVVVGQRSAAPFDLVLVTKPALLNSLPISTDANTASIRGQRFSTVAYDFKDNDADPTDNALILTGGLGQNYQISGTLLLDAQNPTNPFRHKFHPDHANNGPKAYAITRQIQFQFSTPSVNVNGMDQFTGSYQEQITGLHNAPLTVQGTIVLNHVTTAGALNQ